MKSFSCLIVLFLSSLLISHAASGGTVFSPDSLRYQLILHDTEQDREVLMLAGEKIRCKDKGGRKYRGVIRGYSKDAIIFKEEMVPMEELVLIKHFPEKGKWRRRVGGFLKVFAATLAVFFTGRDVDTYLNIPERYSRAQLGGLIFFYVVFAIPIFVVGMWMSRGIKYNLRRRYDWYMDQVKRNGS